MHFSPIFEIHNLRIVAYNPFTFLGTICFYEEPSQTQPVLYILILESLHKSAIASSVVAVNI